MLSIIDLRDFTDLDNETVQIINETTQLSDAQATALARAASHRTGIHTCTRCSWGTDRPGGREPRHLPERDLRKVYTYFARKYPMPRML